MAAGFSILQIRNISRKVIQKRNGKDDSPRGLPNRYFIYAWPVHMPDVERYKKKVLSPVDRVLLTTIPKQHDSLPKQHNIASAIHCIIKVKNIIQHGREKQECGKSILHWIYTVPAYA